MNTDLQHGVPQVAAPHMLKQIETRRHSDAIDQPARPLGAKRQALRARRAQTVT